LWQLQVLCQRAHVHQPAATPKVDASYLDCLTPSGATLSRTFSHRHPRSVSGGGPHRWVYVPSGLYPNRPPGTFCWLKAAAIPLRGSTCDNGKAGCVSGVVAGRGGPTTGGGYQRDKTWHPSYTAGSNGSMPTGVSSCAVDGDTVYVGQRGAGVEPILVLNVEGVVTRGFGSGEVSTPRARARAYRRLFW